MGKTYKKLVANKYTRDFRDAGEIIELEVPTPGPREVLMKNKYGGVNASDVNIAGGSTFLTVIFHLTWAVNQSER